MVWYAGKAGGRMKLRNMTRCGVLAAVLAVCAWLSVPLGDQAVSLQSFGVFLALGLLGGRDGTVTVLVYLLLGAAGVPVFSGFRGGFSVLLGPTGGYLWGFLFTGFCYRAVEKIGTLPAMVMGLLTCYACGTAWYMVYTGGGLTWVVLHTIVPYLIPDSLKIALALHLTRRLKRHLKFHL